MTPKEFRDSCRPLTRDESTFISFALGYGADEVHVTKTSLMVRRGDEIRTVARDSVRKAGRNAAGQRACDALYISGLDTNDVRLDGLGHEIDEDP